MEIEIEIRNGEIEIDSRVAVSRPNRAQGLTDKHN